MQDKTRIEEQVVSQVVQAGLSSQIDEAEDIHVDVKTDVLKAAQGQVDSVSVTGRGMVIQNVRVQELEVQTNGVSVNLLSALFGNLKLDHPVDAAARITLTEADLNRAINSEAIVKRTPQLKLDVEGETVSIELQHPITMHLPGDGKINISLEVLLHEAVGTRKSCITVTAVPRTDDHPLLLEAFECKPGEGFTIEFIIALMRQLKAFLDMPYLEYEGSAFHVKKLQIHKGSLTLETQAYVRQVPS